MLRVITKTAELKDALKESHNIGFVPTMGNLHQGHVSLLEEAAKNHTLCIISIFVNPTQFSKNEDFASYPRTLESDLSKIELAKVDSEIIVFAPESEKELYPEGLDEIFTVSGPTQILEGKLRPEHFDGVTTVVKKFFDIIKPHSAYFGKKDYQQFILIKALVEQYGLNIKIIGMPIIREDTGLALSSRNIYLSDLEKEQALLLISTLRDLRHKLISSKDTGLIQAEIDQLKTKYPHFNYLEMRDKNTLEEVESYSPEIALLGNLQVNKTRLLDNLELEE